MKCFSKVYHKQTKLYFDSIRLMPNAKRGIYDWSRGLIMKGGSWWYSWEWCVGRSVMKRGWGRWRLVQATFYNLTKCEKRARASRRTSAILIEIGFCAEKSSYLERMKWVHLRHDERPISIADLYEARSNRTVRFIPFVSFVHRNDSFPRTKSRACVYVDTHTWCSTIAGVNSCVRTMRHGCIDW